MTLFNPIFYIKLGEKGLNSFYIKVDEGHWLSMNHYEYFKVRNRQNQMSEFEVDIYSTTNEEQQYLKEGNEVQFYAGQTLLLKGRIQKIEYESSYKCKVQGYGMEVKLNDKELTRKNNTTATWSNAKRGQWTNVSAQTLAKEILSENTDGSSPWIIQPNTDGGIFSSDYGTVSMRYENAKRLKAIAKLCESIGYEWWVSQNEYEFDDFFNIAPYKGSQTSKKTYSISGSDANSTKTSKEKDISNLYNYVTFLGYGDGINQLQTITYSASDIHSTLTEDIDSSQTTIYIGDTSDFPNSGTIRVAEEQINYSSKFGNELTGCTRGVNGTEAKSHKKGVYVEKYEDVDSPGENSSIARNGLHEHTKIDKSIMDRETAEVIASRFLLEHMEPIIRIKIKPYDPIGEAETIEIGDKVSIVDSESGIDGDYRIVGTTSKSDYGYLDLEIECSNRSLEFIEQMQEEKEARESSQKYMQGATNLYAISEADNCDNAHPLNMRFYIPDDAIAINKVNLLVKTENYRADAQSVSGAPNSQVNTSFWDANNVAGIHNFSNINWTPVIDDIEYSDLTSGDYSFVVADQLTENQNDWAYFKATDIVGSHHWLYDDGGGGGDYLGYILDTYNVMPAGNFPYANSWGTGNASYISNISSTNVLDADSHTPPSTWNTPFTDALAPDLSGTFDRIRISFSIKNGTSSSKNAGIELQRSSDGSTWSTVQTWYPSLDASQIYHQQIEETSDYRGYVYRLKLTSGITGNDFPDNSWIVMNVGTYMQFTNDLDYGIVEENFPSGSPELEVVAGEEGDESAVSGSPFSISEGSSQKIDITNAIRDAGTEKWMNVKFTPKNGTDHNRIRIESNAYIKLFIESDT